MLPRIEPMIVTIDVEGLGPVEARLLTRREMESFIAVDAELAAELQTELAAVALADVHGDLDEARRWYLELPNPVSVRLFQTLLDRSSGASWEVAQVGESSAKIRGSDSASSSLSPSG